MPVAKCVISTHKKVLVQWKEMQSTISELHLLADRSHHFSFSFSWI